MNSLLIRTLLIWPLLVLPACEGANAPVGMGGPLPPAVKGYADGEEVRFIHTEASDPQIADTLTKMMDSPVLLVPELARVPESALARVYVFANGVKGKGPLGFQPDVFDAVPGTPGYRPLRAIHLVTWKDGSRARVLRSASEVEEAFAHGEITIERPGAVVNMPMIEWPGGER